MIPVIDLLHGRVVRAVRGQRQEYRPLRSTLCPAADPLELVHALHVGQRYPMIYLADLDAIQGLGSHAALLASIAAEFSGLNLWFDGGFRTPRDLGAVERLPRVRAVIGSETWTDGHTQADPAWVLSIDSDNGRPRDASGICADARRRPRELILMDLARVGSGHGPDIGLLERWQATVPGARLHLAGGIRDTADLAAASAARAHGVLVASALHEGRLDGVVAGTFH